jgi:cobalt/nickel transport system permease protein
MEACGYNGDITLYGDVSRPPIHELFTTVGSDAAVVGYAAVAVDGVSP